MVAIVRKKGKNVFQTQAKMHNQELNSQVFKYL